MYIYIYIYISIAFKQHEMNNINNCKGQNGLRWALAGILILEKWSTWPRENDRKHMIRVCPIKIHWYFQYLAYDWDPCKAQLITKRWM